MEAIGKLMRHHTGFVVVGNCCLTIDEVKDEAYCPVYWDNIGPLYSQTCFRCKRKLVHGRSITILFDGGEGQKDFEGE